MATRAVFEYQPGQLEESLQFLKRTRSELSELRMVHVWPDRFQVFDVNGDSFQIDGLGYLADEIIPVLDSVNAVYRRDTIHRPSAAEYKEFKTGRRYPWAADRVM
jgi:hypothetical protein